jgi:hypothetical protein
MTRKPNNPEPEKRNAKIDPIKAAGFSFQQGKGGKLWVVHRDVALFAIFCAFVVFMVYGGPQTLVKVLESVMK